MSFFFLKDVLAKLPTFCSDDPVLDDNGQRHESKDKDDDVEDTNDNETSTEDKSDFDSDSDTDHSSSATYDDEDSVGISNQGFEFNLKGGVDSLLSAAHTRRGAKCAVT